MALIGVFDNEVFAPIETGIFSSTLTVSEWFDDSLADGSALGFGHNLVAASTARGFAQVIPTGPKAAYGIFDAGGNIGAVYTSTFSDNLAVGGWFDDSLMNSVTCLISSTAAGISAPTSLLKGTGVLAATVHGTGGTSSTLKGAGAVLSTTHGMGTTAATLIGYKQAVGTINGVGTGSATIRGTGFVLGTIHGVATGILTVSNSLSPIDAATHGIATASGLIWGTHGTAYGRALAHAVIGGSSPTIVVRSVDMGFSKRAPRDDVKGLVKYYGVYPGE